MGESYMQPASVISDAFRLLFSALDRVFYSLLGLVYELFFNVASADILSNETVMTFFGRVQLILGVFMLFQLAMTILKGIVNPDSFTDAKSGVGNLVTRIITSLVLLTLLVPINIPNPSNEYEAQVNNNGVLFGTLYSLQHRLLANNTLGKLIFGNNSTDYVSSNANTSELKKQSRVFTATVMKSFYRINLLPENQRTQHQEGKDDAIFNADRVCKDIDDSKLSAYLKEDADPGDIAGLVNETCTVSGGGILGTKVYAFSSMPLLSLIVAIIFVFILLSFSVDVAVRAIKLAVLRLIAPIPIIGYMDPKGSKDSSFNAWTKTLTSTYLDLFIRLAAVYFVIFIISDMIYNGIYINSSGGLLGALTAVLIFIGLFVFAKQAPKFIKDVLGLKGDTGNIFSGLGSILGAGAVLGGTVSGGVSKAVATHKPGDTSFKNIGRTVLAGITGAAGGGYAAGRAFWKSKDGNANDVMKEVRAHNARNYSNAADDSTFWGRRRAEFDSYLGLKNQFQRKEEKAGHYEASAAAWKRMDNAFNSDTVGVYQASADLVSSTGETLIDHNKKYSAKQLNDLYGRMAKSGRYSQQELDKVDSAKKQAQQLRFAQIVNATNVANDGKNLTGTAAQIYQGAKTIYQIGYKYRNDSDEVFKMYQGVDDFKDMGRLLAKDSGDFATNVKGAAFNAERQAAAIKSSNEYAQAKADAQHVSDSQKK